MLRGGLGVPHGSLQGLQVMNAGDLSLVHRRYPCQGQQAWNAHFRTEEHEKAVVLYEALDNDATTTVVIQNQGLFFQYLHDPWALGLNTIGTLLQALTFSFRPNVHG